MSRLLLKLCLFSVLLLGVSGAAGAEVDVRESDAEMFPPQISYNDAIQTPAEFLGFPLGRHPVRHHQMVAYLEYLAAQSDRLTIKTIGYSHERRPIVFLIATSPANHGRLDDIQRQHVALSNPETGSAPEITSDMPVVSWINYGVHGAESSGLDAVVPFAYHLAAAQDEETTRVLEQSVVLITAVFNPDGHSKRIAWFDAFGSDRMIGNPDHAEHDYRWGWARTNHYGFDLNRQWLLQTQPEPRAWMAQWHAWRPNLTVDYHEMGTGSTYYFHPGVKTRTNPLVPDRAEELMDLQANRSRAFLDSEARLYFHGEQYDNFYVGKGSTFPLVNGGVGVLYEAAAARGREIETANGLRTYRENIRKQFRTSIASVESAVDLREEYLAYQADFYRDALKAGQEAANAGWVVSAGGDQARLHFFADLLARHRINGYALTDDMTIDGKTYRAGESLVIPAGQAQYTLLRSMFDTSTSFEDSTFYDVSTWTLAPAFGLDWAEIGSGGLRRGDFDAPWVPSLPVADAPAEASFGYLFSWNDYYAPRALNRLLEADLLVRASKKPFRLATTSGIQDFDRGTIFVPFDRQTVTRERIHALMSEVAAEDGIKVYAATAGHNADGTDGVDPGGPSFVAMNAPEILLVVDTGVSHYDSGEIWHLLDHRMNIPVTLRQGNRLKGIDWDRYTHMIFAGGNGQGFYDGFTERLEQWVSEGGTVVALRSATKWVRSSTLDQGAEEAASGDDDSEDESDTPERIAYEAMQAEAVVDLLRGAIFKVDMDITHPMGFGYQARDRFVHKNTSEVMSRPENPYAVVIQYQQDPLLSGYASQDNLDKLEGTPALIAERHGDGSVILFADNPNFRGYWYGSNKLFLNSLFFSTAFEAPND